MAQKLIMPINKAVITASYKNLNYKNQFRYTHFGMDVIGSPTTIYASGTGVVTHCGLDSVFGNVVVVVYDLALVASSGKEIPLSARYFHLSSIASKVGQRVTKDTVLGYMGMTGKLVTGVHLHIEIDTDTKYPNYSPSGSGTIIKCGTDTTLNPASVLYVKTTAPDNQSILGQAYNDCVNEAEAEGIKRIEAFSEPNNDTGVTGKIAELEKVVAESQSKIDVLTTENIKLRAKVSAAINILN